MDQRSEWVRQRLNEELVGQRERLGERLTPGVEMSAELNNGELRFMVDGMVVADRIFVDNEEGPFIAAQWKVLAASMPVTASTSGKQLSVSLRRLPAAGDNPAAVQQIIDFERDLNVVEDRIAQEETEINLLLYCLYGLNPDEIRRIESV